MRRSNPPTTTITPEPTRCASIMPGSTPTAPSRIPTRSNSTKDEPGHQELCEREQRLFLKAIRGEVDLSEHLEDAINSLRIVFAADESMRTGQVVKL